MPAAAVRVAARASPSCAELSALRAVPDALPALRSLAVDVPGWSTLAPADVCRVLGALAPVRATLEELTLHGVLRTSAGWTEAALRDWLEPLLAICGRLRRVELKGAKQACDLQLQPPRRLS